jgi:hypothetical protein
MMQSMPNTEVAARWRQVAFLDEDWSVVPGHARIGHQGGVLAISKSLGRKAYIKPKKPMVPQAAANEKLAADLAHDLGVNVPPAVLTKPPVMGWDGQDLVCASLVMYGFQLHWGAAKHGTRNPPANNDGPADSARGAILANSPWGRALRAAVPASAARALVFDTWVGQADHDHPSNIAWGINPQDESDNAVTFFDYEMAFGVGMWAPVARAPFPAELLALVDHEQVERAVSDVEQYDEDRLRSIVARIDDRHLRPDQKSDIIGHLLARRALVRAALEV